MRFLNAILIKLCLGYILGIYLGFYDVLNLETLLYSISLLILFLAITRFFRRLKNVFLYLSIVLFCFLGCLTTYLKTPENSPHHIVHLDINSFSDITIVGVIDEELRSNNYNHKFIVDDIQIEGKNYEGKLLWQISKEIDVSEIKTGKGVLLFGELKPFQHFKNPQSFNYPEFMNNRDVYGIIYEDQFKLLPHQNFSLNAFGASQREKIILALEESGFEEEHLQLIQALILGQKRAINKEIYDEFAEVGVVHILAVSGLHVGIILAIIQFLLRPLCRIPKYGRPLMVIFSVIGIWCFATLAGFSPSVTRASTMFTFLVFGQLYRRKTNSLNLLFLSAMAMLIYRPQFIFEVGFQLSYVAVFSIIVLYPVFSKLYQPRYKLAKIFTDTAYLSLAAQIGVLPFQLYYFHQFPGLFLAGNLAIIPFLGLLLSVGVLCIVLALFGILPDLIVKICSSLLDYLLFNIEWLAQFKAFVFQDLFFTKPMFIASIMTILMFLLMMREFQKTKIILFLVSILAFSIVSSIEISKHQSVSELVVFHKTGRTLIGVKQGRELQVFSDSISANNDSYILKNYNLLNRIKLTELESLRNFYKIANGHLTIIDSSGIYLREPKGETILLTGSPDIHLGKLLESHQPEKLIADGNNYKSYVERWRKTCESYEVDFYSTYEKGAISFRID